MKKLMSIVMAIASFGFCETQAENSTGINGQLNNLKEKKIKEEFKAYSQNSKNKNYENKDILDFMPPKTLDNLKYGPEDIQSALNKFGLDENLESRFRIIKENSPNQSRRPDESLPDTKIAWENWGEDRFDMCEKTKKNLSKGMQEGLINITNTKAKGLEKDFYKNCLSKPNVVGTEDNFHKIKNRFGILTVNGFPMCTVIRLSSSYIITARHCLFSLPKGGINKFPVTLPQLNNGVVNWEIEFPFLEKTVKNTQANIIYLPKSDGSKTDLVRYDYLQIKDGILINNIASYRQDYMLLEVQAGVLPKVDSIKIESYRKDEKLYFYVYKDLYKESNDLKNGDSFMQSNVGRCQVLAKDPDSNCIYHGCASIKGNSGTPLLVYRDNQFKIIGIHSSAANSKESLCQIKDENLAWTNIGLTVLDINNTVIALENHHVENKVRHSSCCTVQHGTICKRRLPECSIEFSGSYR